MDTINQGDLANLWPVLVGGPPSQADKDAWLGKSFKQLVYDKVIPQLATSPPGVNKTSLINFLQTNLK